MKKNLLLFFVVTCLLTFSGCDLFNNSGGPGSNDREPVYEDITREEALDFIETWRNIYTTHTFDSYISLYDHENFEGIKRSYEGSKKVFDYQGWIKNKRNEFSTYKPEILVENPKVKQLNVNGRTKVSFLQIWVSYDQNYADKGEKVMTLKKINGEILIEYEELLYSQPAYEYMMTGT